MKRRKNKLSPERQREERNAWLFVLPVVIGILIFNVFPVLFSLYTSFTRWNLLNPPVWVNLQNYTGLFTTDPFFFPTLRNTVVYALGTVFVGMVLSLLVAMLLNLKIAGQSIFRAIFFLPVVIPTAAAALAWVWIYDPSSSGILNGFLKFFNVSPIPWLTNGRYALLSVMIEALWASFGLNTVIFLAGLQAIPEEYYEAAELDGANAWNKFIHITLPGISPTSFFVLVTSIIGAIQVFDVPFVMTNGGPANATQMIVMYLYTNAFRLQRMGSASAMGYIVFMIILVLTFINFRLEKKWVFYEE
jgi:multiple sugar transport system permease protein